MYDVLDCGKSTLTIDLRNNIWLVHIDTLWIFHEKYFHKIVNFFLTIFSYEKTVYVQNLIQLWTRVLVSNVLFRYPFIKAHMWNLGHHRILKREFCLTLFEHLLLTYPKNMLHSCSTDCWAEPERRPSCQEILTRLLDCEYTLCWGFALYSGYRGIKRSGLYTSF